MGIVDKEIVQIRFLRDSKICNYVISVFLIFRKNRWR